MKICKKCGKELFDEAVLCPGCGCIADDAAFESVRSATHSETENIPVENAASSEESAPVEETTPIAESAPVETVSETPVPETIQPIKKRNLKAVLIPVIATILVPIFIVIVMVYGPAIKYAIESPSMEANLISRTYYWDNGDERIEYTFTAKGECIVRTYDISGYTPKLLDEQIVDYNLKKTGEETATLDVGGYKYSIDGTLDSFNSSTEFFRDKELFASRQPVEFNTLEERYTNKLMGNGNHSYSGVTNEDYIGAAKTLISNNLKNPSTAVYNSSSVYEKDDYGRAIVHLDVSAQNSYGGWVREDYYVIIQSYKSNGKFTYNSAYSYTSEFAHLPTLKSLNNFGEHPNGSKYENYEVKFGTQTSAYKVSDTVEFTCYTAENEKFTVKCFVDESQENSGHIAAIQIVSELKNYSDDIQKEALLALLNEATGNQITAYLTDNYSRLLNVATDRLEFIKGGYIVETNHDNGIMTISLTDGERYGFTEEKYWTPLIRESNNTGNNTPNNSGTSNNSSIPNSGTTSGNGGTPGNGSNVSDSQPNTPSNDNNEPNCNHLFSTATCTKPATCQLCSVTSGNALGHTYAEATCTKPKTCTVCGITTGSASGHTYAEATCTKPQTCLTCGQSNSNANGHNFIAATCTKPATCKVCGSTSGSASGHSFSPATCTKPATCKTCGTTSGNALGHDYSEATCTKPQTCLICGQANGSAIGHSFNAPTCTKAKTCTICGATSGSPTGHTYIEATCSQPKTCTTCGAKVGSAKDHIWQYTTCTTNKTCSLCNETLPNSVPGHRYTPATCTAAKTCAVCGSTDGVPLGHNYTEATCTSPAKCTKCDHIGDAAKGHSLDEYGSCVNCDYIIWNIKTLSNGVEIRGLNKSLASGEYSIPATINGLPVVGIGDSAFKSDRTMKSILLPDTITYIGEHAFHGVTGLTSIVIPGNVTSVGVNAFWECTNLSEVYIVPDKISIQTYAFSDSSRRNCTLTIYASETAVNRSTASVYWDATCVEWDG